ncbi:hypothetical protein OSTOST_02358, partial [Ostertagia ostertagi]
MDAWSDGDMAFLRTIRTKILNFVSPNRKLHKSSTNSITLVKGFLPAEAERFVKKRSQVKRMQEHRNEA